jgi:hypothetical protein
MKAKYEGWDHGNGGPWECILPVPKGWTQIKSGKTKIGDKCMCLTVHQLKHRGKSNKVKGHWEKVKYIDETVTHFRAVIRRGINASTKL